MCLIYFVISLSLSFFSFQSIIKIITAKCVSRASFNFNIHHDHKGWKNLTWGISTNCNDFQSRLKFSHFSVVSVGEYKRWKWIFFLCYAKASESQALREERKPLIILKRFLCSRHVCVESIPRTWSEKPFDKIYRNFLFQ